MIQKAIVIAQKGSKIIFATEPLFFCKVLSVWKFLIIYFQVICDSTKLLAYYPLR